MDETATTWFLYFMVYSFFGYFVEIIMLYLDKRVLLNRGFLFGPMIPVYGVGSLVFVALSKLTNTGGNPIITFLLASVFCSIVEYIASVLLEKIFKVKLWDYAEDFKYHLNGRICLFNTIMFGFGGIAIIHWVHPFLVSVIGSISSDWQGIIALVLLIIVMIDLILSAYSYFKVKGLIKTGKLDGEKMLVGDNTTEMKILSRVAVAQLFSHKERFEVRAKRALEKHKKKKSRT